jgi:hypothetical protein
LVVKVIVVVRVVDADLSTITSFTTFITLDEKIRGLAGIDQ